MQIVPALLTRDVAVASRWFAAFRPLARTVHVDVLDDTLVPGTTLTPAELPHFQSTSVVWHLMVRDPVRMVDNCLKQTTTAVFVHAEVGTDALRSALRELQARHIPSGIALNPKTPIALVESELPLVQWIQIMTVEPGQQGGEFLAEPLAKLAELRIRYPHLKLAVDGGITEQTIHSIQRYRPAMLAVGSYLAPGPTLPSHWRELQRAITSA
jgi:ribulose-phosphate 3-epimerase